MINLQSMLNERLFLSAKDIIPYLFDYTDDQGVLYSKCGLYGFDGVCYKCVMSWNQADRDAVMQEFEDLDAAIKKIASKFPCESKPIVVRHAEDELPEDLLKIWNTYLRPYEVGDMDKERIAAIESDNFYYNYVEELMDVDEELSKEDAALWKNYVKAVHADEQRRVGKSVGAHDLIHCSTRYYKMLSYGAPIIIMQNASKLLAEALAIHHYCKSREIVECIEDIE